MPVAYDQLRPGDLVLCYGWNLVGGLQATVKTFGRIGTLATGGIPQGTKLLLGDPVAPGAGTAKCNHALIIGQPLVAETENCENVLVGRTEPGCRYKLDRADDPTCIVKTSVSGSESLPIAHLRVGMTDPNPKLINNPQEGKLYLEFKKKGTTTTTRVCHSTGGGCLWSGLEQYFLNHGGGLKVYRMVGADAQAARVGQVAATWANEQEDGLGDKHYSMWKAFTAAFRSHIYGPDAKKRAAFYHTHRQSLGGPPSSNPDKAAGPEKKKKEWFCSMFAIACYQAALYQPIVGKEHDNIVKWLPLDARNASPMTLDGFVSKSPLWTKVGSVP